MPRFSVVIPAYNAVGTIGATIRSILAQTEPDFELIVVDDGSTDQTAALVAGFEDDPRVSLIRQANAGTATARNTGIAAATAEYVSFVDNDDLWMPGYLGAMGVALDRFPEAGFAYCDGRGLDDATSRVHRFTEMHYRPPPPPDAARDAILLALVRVNFVLSSATVRRQALDLVGGYDPNVRGTEDYDLWLRLVLSGRTGVRAGDEPLMLQRGREDNQSKDVRMMNENLELVLRRAAEDPRITAEARLVALGRAGGLARDVRDRDGGGWRRVGQRLRESAVGLRNRLRYDHYWPAEPPEPVAAAFPELAGPDRRER